MLFRERPQKGSPESGPPAPLGPGASRTRVAADHRSRPAPAPWVARGLGLPPPRDPSAV